MKKILPASLIMLFFFIPEQPRTKKSEINKEPINAFEIESRYQKEESRGADIIS
ncbi:hypothetical protein [Flavobacterium pallidum]|uniref:hypothetical protein n=1 Tax=Flavobacterium pallidum TaxID=2172098 RepID=UPI0015E8106C|nr:hypothetical protein [Flavobacterium pallidum]